MNIKFTGIPTDIARKYQRGSTDAYGRKPEEFICESDDLECRHCGNAIERGKVVLLLAWSPFGERQPFAETGPVLLHKEECQGYGAQPDPQPALMDTPTRLVRGYTKDERIVYGTGTHIDADDLRAACESMLEDKSIEFLHIRSSTNNCWQARVDRGS